MKKYGCYNLVFSSSATIYSKSDGKKINESYPINPINPYGRTKATVESLLFDVFLSSENKFRIANLRYFNPIGAHVSGLIGENPVGEAQNIFPLILNAGCGKLKNISIFGSDWDTKDGTGVRDYIHVMDVAEGHFYTLNYLLENKPNILNLNLGTGRGCSVLELIHIFEEVTKVKIPYTFEDRRLGDQGYVVADNSLLIKTLKWSPKRDLVDMCKDGWRWKVNYPNGF